MADSNNIAPAYTAYRDAIPDQAAGDALIREMSGARPDGTGPAVPGAQSAGGSRPQAPATVPQGMTQAPSGTQPSLWQRNVDNAEDFAKGATIQLPRAIYTGARNAVQNSYDMVDDFAKWAQDKIGAATGVYGVGFKGGPHLETQAEADAPDLSDEIRSSLDTHTIADPSTTTGKMIEGVSQFLTGLALTNRALGAVSLPTKLEGAAGYAWSALKGAAANFAAFDPHQERLSNLVQEFPQLQNPVTAYFEAKPGDTAAEGRFKNAVEGLGLGTLADGFVRGVRLLRSAADAKILTEGGEASPALGDTTAAGTAAAPAGQAPGQDALKALGDETAPQGAPIVTRDTAGAPGEVKLPGQEPGTVSGPPTSGAIKINFARIDTPDDVQRTIQELADARASDISAAQRGQQTFEDIKLNAGQQNAWDILQQRRVGEPLNAEQSVAARELWATTATKVQALAQQAVESPNEANLFAFRKMLATHAAVQEQVLGARTETARALTSWRIPVGNAAYRLQEITSQLQDSGGLQENRDLAQRVLALANSTDDNAALKLSEFATKSAFARTRDAVTQAWCDALLTAPTTQTRILASNVTTTLWRMGERALASRISQALGTEGGVAPGEVAAQWSGLVGGFKDALAFASSAWKTGVTGQGIGAPHELFPSNLSAEALHLPENTIAGKAMDLLGFALSLGRRGVAAQHDVALTLAYRMELNAQAVRQATSEVNAGQLAADGLDNRVAELLQNPPEGMVNSSQTAAKYQAFLDEPGQFTQWLLEGRRKIPALRVVAPFLKIPARIMAYTFERTPLAPAMSEFRANVAAGGARRDLALAQWTLGSFISMAAADMALSGRLKGGGPPQAGIEQAQEREGAMRDSMLVGNKWYGINGVHPIGKLMLLAADATEAIMGSQGKLADDVDTEKILSGLTLSIARTMTDATYLKGFSDLFATLHDARVGGSGESALLSATGSAVPAAVGAAARASDPYQRAVYSMLDEFKSRMPGLSKTLPPRRDLWGNPMPSGHDPLTNLLSPVQFSDAHHSPIDDEILRQGFNIQMPDRQQTFGQRGNSVAIDMSKYPQAYSRLLELSGHALKSPAWGMGLQDLLNGIVSGQHPLSAVYNLKSDGPGGGKEIMIRDLISQYRDQAKQQLLREYPALAQEVQTRAAHARALKLGPMAQGAGMQ